MVLAEAGIVGLLAVGFGAVAGMIMLWAILYVSPLLVGWVNHLHPDWVAFPVWSAVGIAVALAAAAWPARRAARTDVVVALRYE
jgi:ABC-type antimicrobial peptide transport system permease subunit